jgi:CheY-like chemotaxis protein
MENNEKKIILLIEDDEIVREMFIAMLENEGYVLYGAVNGFNGLALYNSLHFDLIITDIIMPEKEGIETIFEIRKNNKKIPIIAISGGGRINPGSYLKIAKNLGADYVFSKPVHRQEFLSAIRECLLSSK